MTLGTEMMSKGLEPSPPIAIFNGHQALIHPVHVHVAVFKAPRGGGDSGGSHGGASTLFSEIA